ncbi:MAG: DUF6457 domain-containing protein [Actinomycetes bacterium]
MPTDEHGAAKAWIADYADRLGIVPPTDDEFDALLELAAVAAHGSERVAAPVACWLAGRAGLAPAAAVDAALSGSGGASPRR